MNKLEELNALLKSGAIDENEYKFIKEKLGLKLNMSNEGAKIEIEKKGSTFSTEKKVSGFSIEKKVSGFSTDKKVSGFSTDKKVSGFLTEKKDALTDASVHKTSSYESLKGSKKDSIEETVQEESVKNVEALQEPTKVTQKETASSDSKKKSKTSLIVTLLIVGAIGLIGFLNQDLLLEYFSNTATTDAAPDKLDNYQIESNIIREYVNAIDNRDLIKAISFWHDHPERYWVLHYPSSLEISDKIKDSWRISSYSKNSISDIIKVDKNTYHLSTNFTHTSRKTGISETIKAKVAYIFNDNHMIISTFGIKIDNSESKNDEIIKNIRDSFYYLKNNWVNLKILTLSDDITIFSTLEYPSLNNHFCAQVLNAGINYEFYVNHEKLYFVYSHFEGISNRYYFNPNGEIIMWIDSEKAEVKDGLLAEKNRLNLIFEEIYFNTETNDIKKSNPLGIINDPDGYTNVRADKSSSSSVIYEIYDENKRFVIIDDSGEWWKIKFDINEYPYEIIGFIHNSRVELIDDDEDFLISKNGIINANNLNFRSTPEINNQNIISYLQLGTNVSVLSSVNKTLTNIKHCIIKKDINVNIDGIKTIILSGKMLDILSTKDSYIICGYKQKNGKYNQFSVNYEDVDIIRQEKWYKIEIDNKIGFIYQKFITLQ